MTPETESEPAVSLPMPGQRWMPRRKAMVLTALRNGTVTIEEVCRRYHLVNEEIDGWIAAFERYGVPGLRATRLQVYNDLRTTSRRVPRRARGDNPSRVSRTRRDQPILEPEDSQHSGSKPENRAPGGKGADPNHEDTRTGG
jgi:hypothetical protein